MKEEFFMLVHHSELLEKFPPKILTTTFNKIGYRRQYAVRKNLNLLAASWSLLTEFFNVAAPPADKKEANLPSLSGVAIPTQDHDHPLAPEAQVAVEEAVRIVRENKDILGEIVNFSNSCWSLSLTHRLSEDFSRWSW